MEFPRRSSSAVGFASLRQGTTESGAVRPRRGSFPRSTPSWGMKRSCFGIWRSERSSGGPHWRPPPRVGASARWPRGLAGVRGRAPRRISRDRSCADSGGGRLLPARRKSRDAQADPGDRRPSDHIRARAGLGVRSGSSAPTRRQVPSVADWPRRRRRGGRRRATTRPAGAHDGPAGLRLPSRRTAILTGADVAALSPQFRARRVLPQITLCTCPGSTARRPSPYCATVPHRQLAVLRDEGVSVRPAPYDRSFALDQNKVAAGGPPADVVPWNRVAVDTNTAATRLNEPSSKHERSDAAW